MKESKIVLMIDSPFPLIEFQKRFERIIRV
jgi:hypothetical protein